MKSPSISTADRTGFTLIEVLFVIGFFLTIATWGTLASVKHLQQATLLSDRDTLVTLLWDARVLALANLSEVPHGVHITDTAFISFSGDVFDPRETPENIVSHEHSLSVTGARTIIFEPITGNAQEGSSTTTISKDHEEASIEVNALGRIAW